MAANDVTVSDDQITDMQDYLNLDTGVDDTTLKGLIEMAIAVTVDAADRTIPADFYQKYPEFKQAVRVLVDFMYYSRGTLSDQKTAYPPSFLMLVNSFRFRIRGDYDASSSQSV